MLCRLVDCYADPITCNLIRRTWNSLGLALLLCVPLHAALPANRRSGGSRRRPGGRSPAHRSPFRAVPRKLQHLQDRSRVLNRWWGLGFCG